MKTKYLAVPGYSVAALLVLFPLLDSAISVFPPRFGEIAWRFGAAGLFSRALMTPILGLLLAFSLALLLEHSRVQRAISVFSALVGVVVIAVVGLFLLDAMQMRAQVRPEAKTAFDVASLVALGKYGIGTLVLAAFSVSGWRSSRGAFASKKRVRSRRGTGDLVMGSQPVRS
jgi:hypothetical protein